MLFFPKIYITFFTVVIIVAALFYYIKIPSNAPLPIDKSISENNPSPSNTVNQETEVGLKAKIGQMILLGFRGTTAPPDSSIARTIQYLNIGGVILFDYDVPSKSFPRNIINPEQTKKLISDLQTYANVPLLVSVDAEGGKVNRLQEKYGFVKILSAEAMGKDAMLKTTQQESQKLVQELKELGFNMNFAPVVDVNVNPKNPVIGVLERSFSANPQMVINNARVMIQNHRDNHIIPVAKHFPGHGSSTSDSHLGLVNITNTYQEKELLPYTQLQKEGLLDVVMTAHVMNKSIDKDYPATLSPLFIQDILRKKVGFEGVVISDDMQMNAIVDHYGFEEAMVKSINAGCDILLLSNNGTKPYDKQLAYKAVDAIYKAVQEGKITEQQIEDSYHRIFNLKKKFGIVD